MIYLNIVCVVLSGIGLGFGAFTLSHAKPVNLWGVRVCSAKVRGKLYKLSGAALIFGLAVLLSGLVLIYKVWAELSVLYSVLCICLWIFSLIIGSVCADFTLARYRDFSEISFLLLSELEAVKTAEQKLIKAYGAVIGFEGIVFMDKGGGISDVLWFADFGLDELKRETQTDILCQYFKSTQAQKEIHSVSNKLSLMLDVDVI